MVLLAAHAGPKWIHKYKSGAVYKVCTMYYKNRVNTRVFFFGKLFRKPSLYPSELQGLVSPVYHQLFCRINANDDDFISFSLSGMVLVRGCLGNKANHLKENPWRIAAVNNMLLQFVECN